MWGQLQVSDEFRMRSPVGWLFCGIVVVVCIISAKSGVALSNYRVIHGHGIGYPGPILQGIVPTIGYRRVVPQLVARRIETLRNYDDENEENRDEDEDVMEEADSHPSGPAHPDQNRAEEEQDLEEEDEESEDRGEFAFGGVYQNPESDEDLDEQYSRSNKILIPANTVPRKIPIRVRTSSTKNASKETEMISTDKGQSIKKNKSPLAKDEMVAPETKQKLNRRTMSGKRTQYVATPIADLILRLSISLAKPIGHGNGTATYFNVPIRLSNGVTEHGNSSALKESLISNTPLGIKMEEENKNESMASSVRPSKVVAVPLNADVVSKNTEVDDKEDNVDTDQVSA